MLGEVLACLFFDGTPFFSTRQYCIVTRSTDYNYAPVVHAYVHAVVRVCARACVCVRVCVCVCVLCMLSMRAYMLGCTCMCVDVCGSVYECWCMHACGCDFGHLFVYVQVA